ncbi:hypothetical protein Rs2_04974 [Raphanus sativus]|nr:hypothetical protein Rs2_04974 [Raphanus sativus]
MAKSKAKKKLKTSQDPDPPQNASGQCFGLPPFCVFCSKDPCYWIYGSRRDYLRLTGFPLSVSTSTLHRRSYPSFVVCLEIPWSSKPFGSLVLESFSTSMPVNVQYLQS